MRTLKRGRVALLDQRIDEEALAQSIVRARILGGEFLAAISRWLKAQGRRG